MNKYNRINDHKRVKYEIFNNNVSCDEINSFLNTSKLSHNNDYNNSIEWFNYKYKLSPLGEAILAVATDDDLVVGCVALGSYRFRLKGNVFPGFISYETFVHPEYQGRGIFTKLATLAETESIARGAKLLMNFPNKNSMPGFVNLGWTKQKTTAYYIKPLSILSFMKYLSSLPKPFVTTLSVNRLCNNTDIAIVKSDNNYYEITSDVSTHHVHDFIKWRFLENSIANYGYYMISDILFIYRIGQRGFLKEAQLLYIYSAEKLQVKYWGSFFDHLQSTESVDYVGVPLSVHHPLAKTLPQLLFIRVPNKAGFAYKILDNTVQFNKASFIGIDYHTY